MTVLAVVCVVAAAPASAHAQWLGSDPQEGATLTEPPASVVMTYSETIAPEFVETALIPPDGEPVLAEGTAGGVDVVIDVAGAEGFAAVADQAGQWQVVSRVVSADGHPIEHTTTFEVVPAASPAASAGASSPPATQPSATDTPAARATDGAAASAEPVQAGDEPAAGAGDGGPGWTAPMAGLAVLVAVVAAVVLLRRRTSAAR
ncbi:copper resistance CopC family protein [Aquipuribacter hungaricus]|uniref:Copper resistance CopC family protein n=1 Tax=Aquipuribacter hungaricus TaxID=545624 RepID=A0ABV7WM69_9MICO